MREKRCPKRAQAVDETGDETTWEGIAREQRFTDSYLLSALKLIDAGQTEEAFHPRWWYSSFWFGNIASGGFCRTMFSYFLLRYLPSLPGGPRLRERSFLPSYIAALEECPPTPLPSTLPLGLASQRKITIERCLPAPVTACRGEASGTFENAPETPSSNHPHRSRSRACSVSTYLSADAESAISLIVVESGHLASREP